MIALSRFWIMVGVLALAIIAKVDAANPPPTQVFYVPFPENDQLVGFKAVDTTNQVAKDPLTVFVTFAAATDGTVIYYDHWEDGYEPDITNPVQSTTLVFGDGNAANGYPPGNAADLIPAGTVFNLRNFVTTTTLQSVVDYDARDKIATFKPISITKTSFPDGTDTLMAGCVEMFERGLWGNEYRSPVGVDMPTSTATASLTYDEDVFSYVALSIMAGTGGASVQIDKNNDGAYEETVALVEGETVYRDAVNVGGHILSDRPVQVVLFTGTIGSTYGSRDTMLLPVYRWSSDYFAPVTTPVGNGTVTYLYNPGTSAITVSYDYRDSTSTYVTGTISVPAGGNARVNMLPANGTNHFGAYRFYTTGANPPAFYAISAIDADGTVASSANTAWDGGFTLVGKPSLTTQVLVSLGIGRDPYSATNPNENGNPIWITTSGNGHTAATVYVDYDGDNAGGFTDPNGNAYDISYSLRELQQQKIFDPDGDQSGMLIYTLNSSIRIAAMWGQDPTVATNSQPGLDVAALVPPLREGDAGKKSNLIVDSDGDGYISTGDTLEYDIRAINSARTNIPGPFGVVDTLPANVTYVSGSTRYRFSVGGSWQAWTTVPDSVSGTPFPLDGTGLSVPGTIGTRQQLQVVFNSVVKDYASLAGGTVTNTGQVEISPYGLVLPVEWTDTIYGSIGDRLWVDLDGDGVQDSGEVGIPGVDVFADLNNNGFWNTGEPKDTTDSNGNYLLGGLAAGTYQIRVDAADISVINVGYGPTYDLDGNATSNVASVVLAAAQERVDADFGYRVGASVGNRVWTDIDADGVQDSGEPGINGVRVYLDLNNNDAYDSNEPNTITSGDGVYYIGNLSPGTFAVRVDTSTLPGNSAQTYDLSGALDHEGAVTLIAAEHNGLLDFGYRGTLSIGDLVWEDVNGDGLPTTTVNTTWNVDNGRVDLNNDGNFDNSDDGFIGTMQIINGYADINGNASTATPDAGDDGTFLGVNIVDGGFDLNGNGTISTRSSDDGTVTYTSTVSEPFIANVRVFIDANGNGLFDANEISAVTNASGNYTLGNLFSGTHIVRVDTTTLPSSFVPTYDLTSPVGDHSATVVLSGASRTDADFGYRNDATLGDLVWNDRDADGVRDPGEQGIEGVIVYIDADGDNAFDQGVERYDITDVNGYYLIENLAAGTYAVRVEISTLPQGATQTYDLDGTGTSHEASRTLTTSQNGTDVDFGYRATAAFGNFVWNDTDADGVQDGGETGISGVRVYLDINGNGTFESASEPSALTDAAGAYSIANLLPGTYTARIDSSSLTAGLVQTYDLNGPLDLSATFFISATQTRDDIDFGFTTRISIGDLVWNDLNADGQKGAGEPGLEGVTVTAFNAANDTIAATTTSDVNGAYSFSSLMPGTYYLIFGRPSAYDATLADRGADTSDSDADPATGRTPNVTLTGGLSDLTIDAGFYQPASIGDFVWNDLNANGQQDVGETGLSGVTVSLYRPGFGADGISGNADDAAVITTATTISGGAYGFSGLRPGTYQIGFSTLSGHNRTLADQGADTTDSDANAGTGLTATFAVAAGQANNSIDAGYYQPIAIGDFVWNDANANGQQDSGETGLSGVTVTLYRPGFGPDGIAGNADDATAVTTATTISGGAYNFTNLPPGTYQIGFSALSGYGRTLADQGADTTDSDANATTGLTATFAVAAGQSNTTIDAGYYQSASIGDFVWSDLNANGQQDVGDTGLSGVTVSLYRPGFGADGIAGNADDAVVITTATTVSGGAYSFSGLRPGTYQIGFSALSGYGRTLADQGADTTDSDANASSGLTATFAIAPGQANTTIDAGYYQFGSIGDFVWNDLNANGQQDGGETGLSGVTVSLYRPGFGADGISGNADDAAVITTATTISGGAYGFSGLRPGTYQIGFSTLSGYNRTPADQGVNTSDSDANASTGLTATFAVAAGQANNSIDAGYYQPGAITGSIFADTDNNNTGDVAISGVTLTLKNSAGNDIDSDPLTSGVQPTTTTTNASGIYTFSNLPPASYRVVQTQPSGYLSVSDVDGLNNNVIGDQTPIVVAAGQTVTDRNFVEEQPGIVSGHLYIDTNGNGVQDGVEPNLANVDVLVTDSAGGTQTVTTNASGNWTATVQPGSTSANVQESDPQYPTGYLQTEGSDPTTVSVAAGASVNGGVDGYYQPATVTGHLYIDTNGNGAQDGGEPDLEGVDVLITNSLGGTQTVATNASGNWTASVPPGSTSANVQESDPQYPTGYTQTEGNDPTIFTAVAGASTNGGIDGYFLPGSITGFVLADTNNDNTGDTPLSGVVLTLLDSSGSPVLNAGNPVTTTTALNGSYTFGNLPPGTYGVAETQPSGYNSVSDKDDGNLNEIRPITVAAGVSNTGNTFIEEQPGSISGTVFKDTDGDGDSDAPLANVTLSLLDNLGQPVLDGSSQPVTTTSASNGTYSFTNVSPGNYRVVQTQPANYNSVSDTDGANNNVIGDTTPIAVSAGNNNGGNNFIEIELGVISGYVLLDTDNNGSGNAPLPGVVVNLLDGSGSPVLDGFGAPIQVASGVGGYYSFTLVPVGTYRVSQNQPSGYGSVSDVDGANNNVVGDETPIVMTPGLVVTDRNFVEIQLGSISGLVYVDASPLAGVTLTLLDGSGNPIDGDPNTSGVQLVTTVTDSTGFYRFAGLMPGTYRVAQTQPFGYISSSDADTGDLDIIGDVTVITVLPGQENTDNDFIETPDTCPDTWAEWKFQHPGEQADGNPDADAYDNLNEFAFAMPAGSGAGNAWTIQPSALNVGTIEGVFIRPKGATLNVTYTLEYAEVPDNPTVWQSILITPTIITTSDNGDCTETVTIHGLESLTGFTDGKGVVRIKAELDEENDTVIDHTSHTEVEGWKETGFELCCRTYSNPFLRETELTGTISAVTGQTIELPVSAGTQDLGSLLFSGSYYVEVTSGENEGHRFDIVSASGDSMTLATDTNLFENAPPHNSLTGALPANLAGDAIVVRRHWTLGELFPPLAFGGTDDRATADQIQLFTDGQWTIYWLYNDGISPQHWVKTGDNTYADQAATIIPPGQGLFFNNRAAVNSILAYGEVRNNDFIRPLATGSNLVSGGYPLDQSTVGREMRIAEGFFGSRDIATADTFYVWRADETLGATGYDTYFLNNNAPRLPSVIKWVKIGDASLLSRDAEILLLGNRSVFIRSKNGISTYTISSPWTP